MAGTLTHPKAVGKRGEKRQSREQQDRAPEPQRHRDSERKRRVLETDGEDGQESD